MRSKITISHNINRTSTPHNNHTLKEGVVETSEVEEEEEEDLVEEEIKLHPITMDNQVTMPDISWKLRRHVHIVRDMTIMWRNVLS